MTILFLLSTILLVVICLVLLSLRGKRYTVEKVEFDTSAYDQDPIRMRGLLIRHRTRESQRLPGIVFCPGLAMNKETYLGLCKRIANLGVAVMAIDLRGHGQSGGPSTFGQSESRDVWAAIDLLGGREDVDPDRLGVIGHSLGGIAATRAGFEQPFDRIKTAIAIYCWKGFGEAVEAVFGPLEGFVGRWWPYFGWSRRFSVTDPEAVLERSVIDHVGPEVRINYLLLVGSRDPLTDMSRSREIVAKAAGQSGVEPGVTYGSFAEGAARRIEIVKGANHFSVLSRRRTFAAMREWLENTLGVEGTGQAPRSSFSSILRHTRKASVLLQGLSTLAFAGCLMSMLVPEQMSGAIPTPPLSASIVATAAFLLCSALAIPLVRTLRFTPFTPNWGADIVSLIEVTRAVLFAPLLALIIASKGGAGAFAFEALGLGPRVACSGIVVAGVLFLWLVCSWNMVARTNRFPTLWPVVRIRTFSMLLCLLFVSYLAEEALFRGMIQRQLSGIGPVFEVLLSAIAYSLMAAIGMTVAVLPLFPSLSYAATFRSRSIALLPVVFVFALAVFLVHGLAAALLYHVTGTILAPALFLALLVSFLFTGPIGMRTY
jgi:pimeloyl-ACP methyl ester carboxylesterase